MSDYNVYDFLGKNATDVKLTEADFLDQANKFARVRRAQDEEIERLKFENSTLTGRLLEVYSPEAVKTFVEREFSILKQLQEDIMDLQEDYSDLLREVESASNIIKLRERQLTMALNTIKDLKSK